MSATDQISIAPTTQENPYGTEGVSHVGLAVSKLDKTADFFIKILGWKKVRERPDYPAIFVSSGIRIEFIVPAHNIS